MTVINGIQHTIWHFITILLLMLTPKMIRITSKKWFSIKEFASVIMYLISVTNIGMIYKVGFKTVFEHSRVYIQLFHCVFLLFDIYCMFSSYRFIERKTDEEGRLTVSADFVNSTMAATIDVCFLVLAAYVEQN
jgi:hypothetical protein